METTITRTGSGIIAAGILAGMPVGVTAEQQMQQQTEQSVTAQEEQSVTMQDEPVLSVQQEQISAQQDPATAQQEQTAQTLQVNLAEDFGYIFRSKEYNSREDVDSLVYRQIQQQEVSHKLGQAVKDGKKLNISFKGITRYDAELFLYAICSLYHYFPVQTVDDSITVVDLIKLDQYDFERLRKSTILEVYEPERYAMRFKFRCELMNETDDMTDDEKIWLKYENSNNSTN
jgi:hypothetical protein